MKSLTDIQSQIKKLQDQADQIKTKESEKVLSEITKKMQAFGISVKDIAAKLGVVKESSGSVETIVVNKKKVKDAKVNKGTKKTTGGSVAPKYQGPNGEQWSGRGLTPKWLSSLTAQGNEKSKYLIQNLVNTLNPVAENAKQDESEKQESTAQAVDTSSVA